MADDVPGAFQLPQRPSDGVHALLADFRKSSGGVVPVLRQGQHHGQKPLGFQRQRLVAQVVVAHNGIITGPFNTKNGHFITPLGIHGMKKAAIFKKTAAVRCGSSGCARNTAASAQGAE